MIRKGTMVRVTSFRGDGSEFEQDGKVLAKHTCWDGKVYYRVLFHTQQGTPIQFDFPENDVRRAKTLPSKGGR